MTWILKSLATIPDLAPYALVGGLAFGVGAILEVHWHHRRSADRLVVLTTSTQLTHPERILAVEKSLLSMAHEPGAVIRDVR